MYTLKRCNRKKAIKSDIQSCNLGNMSFGEVFIILYCYSSLYHLCMECTCVCKHYYCLLIYR